MAHAAKLARAVVRIVFESMLLMIEDSTRPLRTTLLRYRLYPPT